MSSGPASRRQHAAFCPVEGWSEVRNARGQKVRHHITYELALANGDILRTRISRPANNDTYGPALWSTILQDQLRVTETEFWNCVDRGVRPVRDAPAPTVPTTALPAGLAYQLVHSLGLTERQVAALDRPEAVRLMTEYWSRPP